ncbi:DUF2089 domain-containing protein [Chloroflexi bacterium TSY]|nr:DUF2089 domain-containing protein [Chloroflexi bacterium TSY]
MERELGISYWTIRSRLNHLITDLGFEAEAKSDTELKDQRRDILEQVDQGELSAADAAELLSQLQ